ncbi:MAG: 4-alpha-glucanotransferase [Euryarchaeota archaeon]|nr:4-alpha-glucanotransferase [Euryarchaeota archaeon]
MRRKVGVLCHITSLPSINIDSGKRFIDILSANNISAWQMLPITPPDFYGSPYASSSAFAGFDKLVEGGREISMEEESYWLEDWALFKTIREAHENKPWTEWPIELRDRYPESMDKWRKKIDSEILNQTKFHYNWLELRKYANERQLSMIGDIPIFVAHDSADVWAHPHLFQLEKDGYPSVVAGVPPDYFSEDGQRWGTVLYRWEEHRAENFKWWRERMSRMMRLFDIVRIDHFRGFHSAWAISVEDNHARNGYWQDGPKDEIIKQIIDEVGDNSKIIAEDLGIIPPEVIDLRKRNNLNGMAVLQFGFDGDLSSNPHYPSNIGSDLVAYTGTHDNDTTRGWLNSLNGETLENIKQVTNVDEIVVKDIIQLAVSSKAEMVIIPIQDFLNIDSRGRMNTPGIAEGNWKWSFEWEDLENASLIV